MTDEVDSPVPPRKEAASQDQWATRAHERVPVLDDVLRQISDDLRTHARAMAAAIAELKRLRTATIKRGGELEAIEHSARRMTQLVDDLLDLALIRRGTFVLCRDTVRVEDLIGEALGVLRVPVRRKGIHLECPLPEAPVLLRCDEERVLRLITNLIHLAIDCALENGLIAIHTWNVEGGIKVAISDSGSIGRTLEHDLAAASASRHGRLQSGSNAGLSLQLAHAIADAHGGSIAFETDNPLDGYMISLLLPRDLPAFKDAESRC